MEKDLNQLISKDIINPINELTYEYHPKMQIEKFLSKIKILAILKY